MAKKRTMYRNTTSGELVPAREALASSDPSAYVAETVPATFKVEVVGIADNETGKARIILDVAATREQLEALRHRLRLQVRP